MDTVEGMAAEGRQPEGPHAGLPLWKGNLFVFGILFVFVLVNFFLQASRAKSLFMADARDHARLVADMVALQARWAIRSAEVSDETLALFLTNTARFVSYLDAVEPFDSHELAAFAQEAGLSGVAVIRKDGTRVEGPTGWTLGFSSCEGLHGLIHDARNHEIRLVQPSTGGGCVVTGVPGRDLEELRREISLERVIEKISRLHGISFVSVVETSAPTLPEKNGLHEGITRETPVTIGERDGKPVAEVTVGIGSRALIVGMDASPLQERISLLFRDFSLFGGLLAVSAALLSWLLYRQQSRHFMQVEEYERRLSRRREEAALGRAAASIAHEVRNPLNAMSMGLQRLSMEADELTPQHRRLISVVLESLARTNGIVSNLLDYARPPRFHPEKTGIETLVEDAVSLLKDVLEKKGIVVQKAIPPQSEIFTDRNLICQVMANLLRNAAEAAPENGTILISAQYEGETVVLHVENDGTLPEPDEIAHVFEPYFTTKTRGTGLGLAISRKIVLAMAGTIAATIRNGKTFVVTVRLPRNLLSAKTLCLSAV